MGNLIYSENIKVRDQGASYDIPVEVFTPDVST